MKKRIVSLLLAALLFVTLLPAEALSDHIIDLTKYDELERVNNMDIQCYQFAVSVGARRVAEA